MPSRRPPLIVLALIALALLAAREARAQSLTSGAIQGVITDTSTGEALAGVTVVATSAALQGDQAAITDENGQYKITNLPPGVYLLSCHYMDVTVLRRDLAVSANKTTPGFIKLDTTQAKGEIITIEGLAPAIDPTSTTQGVTLDQRYLKNLPVGRTYDDVIASAGGASTDDAGVSFSGSSSLENQYLVDGVNTTTLTYGQVGSPLVNEFIQEIEIITGGYNAEHGRSTGGVVNVVTKSGSNDLHGSVFGYASPGFLIAQAQATPTQTASIDAESSQLIDADGGFELGGPIVRDRLWFYVGLAPHVQRAHLDRITKRRMDCHALEDDGGLSGCDPALADGAPDVDPATGFLLFEELDRTRLGARTTSYPFVAKLNLAVAPEHQGQVSLTGTPATGNQLDVDGLPTATQREYQELTTNLAVKWTSKLNDSKTELEAVAGWHRARYHEDPLDARGRLAPRQNLFNGDLGTWGRLGGESNATIAGCDDLAADDRYPLIRNCPDEGTGYAIGGAGALADATEARLSGRLGVTQRVTTLGRHEIKAGVDVEDNRLTTRRGTSGDIAYDVYLPTDPMTLGEIHVHEYVRLAAPGSAAMGTCPDTDHGTNLACDAIGATDVVGQTVNWAAYLRDSWQLRPELTVNVGLRYEEQRLRYARGMQDTDDPFTGEHRGTNAMVLRGMLAPRVGVVYDWTREGRSKLYGHWGRFYESVPMDLNSINFGGETSYRRVYQADQCGMALEGVGGPDGPGCLAGGADPALGSNVFGSGVLVAPGIKAQYLDESILGVEYAVLEDLKLGLALHDRRLGRVLEDVSPDNTETYILSNPGEFPADEEARLRAELEATTDPDEHARLEHLIDVYTGIREFDRPTRVYQAVQVSVVKQFSDAFFLQGSYTYARNRGNFPGLYSPDSGAINPNITAQYDLIELLANREGPLPNDRPHDLKVDGYYRLDLDAAGVLTTGARFRVASGTPVDALASNAIYGFDESFALPRGAIGRTPAEVGTDLHLSYGRRFGKGVELEIFADLFDVLDRQAGSYLDETYTHDNVNPIVGGDGEDLVWVKTQDAEGNEPDDPTTITRSRNFRNARTRTPPMSGRLGARMSF